jgi:hypothetical protein
VSIPIHLNLESLITGVAHDLISNEVGNDEIQIIDSLSTEDREIRIFISSPFIDMQEERNLMVKKVIPKLRKISGERDVTISYVDLRWYRLKTHLLSFIYYFLNYII